MATEKTREDVEIELWWEKKQKKFFLICTAICTGIGIIIGAVIGITSRMDVDVVEVLVMGFAGLWIGAGVGCGISYIPFIFHTFKLRMKEGGGCLGEGCYDTVKFFLIVVLIGFFVFSFLGPIGLLIRFLMANHKIKKLEKELSGFGQ